MAAPENWCMSVEGRIYGPYSTDQMQAFVAQKRLAYHSLVAPAGSNEFRPALQYPELKPLFSGDRGRGPARTAGSTAKIVIFGSEAGARSARDVLDRLSGIHHLSGTAFLALTADSVEVLRDTLAKPLPSTERVVVVTAGEETASYGISLTEHEMLIDMLGRSKKQS